MMKHASLCILLVFLAALPASGRQVLKHSPWESRVVSLEVTRNQDHYVQPWSKRTESIQKTGLVVGPRQILTTADQLADRTLVRLQKSGRGKWWNAEVEWVDYHANLAIVTTADAAFWNGLAPATLADPIPGKGEAQLVRWREGTLEARKGEINRVTVKRGRLTFMDHLHLDVDCDIKNAGWAEVVVAGSKVIGITSWSEGSSCVALPSPFIRSILEARKRGTYRGLGFFAFTWQRSENPALHKRLRVPGEPRGVVVIEVPAKPGLDGTLKPQDLILQVDGFDIDIQGDYADPFYGNLSLENLATRQHWAGDEVPLKVWRAGQMLDIRYRLPKADYAIRLVPQAVFDQEPEYLVVGGLVFQPLTEPYLRSWGTDWRRRVPFRLAYYEQEKPTAERPSLVILSVVLPDPYNLGYQDYRYVAVNRVNGEKIARLADVYRALEKPLNGFHVVDFDFNDSLQRLVLDADKAEAATQRVLKRYGIEKDHVFVESQPAK